jgi:hypothetical protein
MEQTHLIRHNRIRSQQMHIWIRAFRQTIRELLRRLGDLFRHLVAAYDTHCEGQRSQIYDEGGGEAELLVN